MKIIKVKICADKYEKKLRDELTNAFHDIARFVTKNLENIEKLASYDKNIEVLNISKKAKKEAGNLMNLFDKARKMKFGK